MSLVLFSVSGLGKILEIQGCRVWGLGKILAFWGLGNEVKVLNFKALGFQVLRPQGVEV